MKLEIGLWGTIGIWNRLTEPIFMAEFGVRQRWASCVPGFDRIYLVVTDGLLGESDEVFVVGVHVCQFAVDEHDNLIFAPLLLLSNVSRDDTLRLLSQTGVPIHLGGITHGHAPLLRPPPLLYGARHTHDARHTLHMHSVW